MDFILLTRTHPRSTSPVVAYCTTITRSFMFRERPYDPAKVGGGYLSCTLLHLRCRDKLLGFRMSTVCARRKERTRSRPPTHDFPSCMVGKLDPSPPCFSVRQHRPPSSPARCGRSSRSPDEGEECYGTAVNDVEKAGNYRGTGMSVVPVVKRLTSNTTKVEVSRVRVFVWSSVLY